MPTQTKTKTRTGTAIKIALVTLAVGGVMAAVAPMVTTNLISSPVKMIINVVPKGAGTVTIVDLTLRSFCTGANDDQIVCNYPNPKTVLVSVKANDGYIFSNWNGYPGATCTTNCPVNVKAGTVTGIANFVKKTCAGTTLCGNDCVNLQNNIDNCGSCGKKCTSGQTCIAGACVTPTPSAPDCTVTIRTTATSVVTGGSSNIYWSSTNTVSPCWGNSTGSGSLWLGNGAMIATKQASPGPTTGKLNSTTTYKVTCANSAGKQCSSSVTVNVAPAPPKPASCSRVSDPNYDIYTKGQTSRKDATGSITQLYDYCTAGNKLIEPICNQATGAITDKATICQGTCNDGACVKCVCDTAKIAETCAGTKFANSCGKPICVGTKNCSSCNVSVKATSPILSGYRSTVSWTSSGASGCWGWQNNPTDAATASDLRFVSTFNNGGAGFIALNGSGITDPLMSSKRYQVTCWTTGDKTCSGSAIVNVNPQQRFCACDPNRIAATCSGIKFPDSCNVFNACTGTKSCPLNYTLTLSKTGSSFGTAVMYDNANGLTCSSGCTSASKSLLSGTKYSTYVQWDKATTKVNSISNCPNYPSGVTNCSNATCAYITCTPSILNRNTAVIANFGAASCNCNAITAATTCAGTKFANSCGVSNACNGTKNCSTCTVSVSGTYSINRGTSATVNWSSSANTIGCWGWQNSPTALISSTDGRFVQQYSGGKEGFLPTNGRGTTDILTASKRYQVACWTANNVTCVGTFVVNVK